MTARLIEPFDRSSIAQLGEEYGNAMPAGASLVAGEDGGQALRFDGASDSAAFLDFPETTDDADIVVGFRFRIVTAPDDAGGSDTPNTYFLAWYRDAGGSVNQGFLNLKRNGSAYHFVAEKAFSGTGTPNITSAAVSITVGEWHHAEVRFRIGNPGNGQIEVKLDGTTVFSEATIDYKHFGTSLQSIRLGARNNAVTDYAHLYVLDGGGTANTTFLGVDARTLSRLPTADAGPNDGTPTGAGTSNANRVSEAPADDDTTYVDMSTAGNVESYTHAALPATVASIAAVRAVSRVKAASGSPTARARIDSGGTVATGTTKTPGASYGYLDVIRETDPATGVAWTPAAVSALKQGAELVTASSATLRMTQSAVDVLYIQGDPPSGGGGNEPASGVLRWNRPIGAVLERPFGRTLGSSI